MKILHKIGYLHFQQFVFIHSKKIGFLFSFEKIIPFKTGDKQNFLFRSLKKNKSIFASSSIFFNNLIPISKYHPPIKYRIQNLPRSALKRVWN